MLNPQKNIGRYFDANMSANLLLVFKEIDRYKMSERRKFSRMLQSLRADTDDEQTAQGPAAQGGRPLSQRELEEFLE